MLLPVTGACAGYQYYLQVRPRQREEGGVGMGAVRVCRHTLALRPQTSPINFCCLQHDDDLFILKPVPVNLVQEMRTKGYKMASHKQMKEPRCDGCAVLRWCALLLLPDQLYE